MKRLALPLAAVLALSSATGSARAEGPGLLPDAPDGQPDPQTAAPPAPLDPDRLRARFGFDVAGGSIVGRGAGPLASVRVGLQLSALLGVHVQTQLGGFIGNDFGFFSNNAIMGSLVLEDLVELSAGPSIDVRATGTSLDQGAFPGVATRLGFLVGQGTHRAGRRSGISIVFHAHPTFLPTESGGQVTRTLFAFGLGGEWF